MKKRSQKYWAILSNFWIGSAQFVLRQPLLWAQQYFPTSDSAQPNLRWASFFCGLSNTFQLLIRLSPVCVGPASFVGCNSSNETSPGRMNSWNYRLSWSAAYCEVQIKFAMDVIVFQHNTNWTCKLKLLFIDS